MLKFLKQAEAWQDISVYRQVRDVQGKQIAKINGWATVI